MAYIDVFNGDADGICALTQWRHAYPATSQQVTGVKRDIQLLDRITPQAGDDITVLDISLDKNRQGLLKALELGAQVFYVDHHFAGDIPRQPQLTAIINTMPNMCTSLLMNQHLKGLRIQWAIVGTFGDNLHETAYKLAKPLGLSRQQLIQLENLGLYMNYNSYGFTLEDLHIAPAELYQSVCCYTSPLDFMVDAKDNFDQLEQGYQQDKLAVEKVHPYYTSASVAVFILPDKPWARRISGVYSNDLANQTPQRAHAVLTVKTNGHYLVSVRAPLANKRDADTLCRRFATGGGRAAAAGINDLPVSQLDDFISALCTHYRA